MLKRENSFLKLKQEQWAKQKADQENQEWFPFGSNLKPGGGSPLRKFAPKEPINTIEKSEGDEKVDPIQESDPEPEMQHRESQSPHQHHQQNPYSPQHPQQHVYPPYGNNPYMYPYPIYPPYPYPYHHHPMNQDAPSQPQGSSSIPWSYGYQVIPPNAIPVSTINLDPSICPVEQFAAFLEMPKPPPGMRYGIPIPPPAQFINPAMTSSMSSNESGVSGMTSKKEKLEKAENLEKQSTSDYNEDDPPTRKNTAELQMDYQKQIEERRKYEQKEEEREKREEQEIKRQQEELERRREMEMERQREVDRRRVEEERRRTEQFAEAIEKAKKEAELLKKAKLFKHVLCGDNEEELKQKLLGVDEETEQRLLKEVHELEYRKMWDAREIQEKAPKTSSQRTRSSSISENPMESSTTMESRRSSLTRNGFGRRSVRTTSREKQEADRRREEHLHHSPQQSETITRSRRSCENGVEEEEEMRKTTYQHRKSIDRNLENGEEEEADRNHREQTNTSDFSKFFMKNSMMSNGENDQHKASSTRKNTDNMVTQNALFGQVPTRLSTRRLRNTKMQTATATVSPQPITVLQQREMHSSSSFENDEGLSSGGSLSPDHNHNTSPPNSEENVHPKLSIDENRDYKIRTRSALGSPSNYLNGGGGSLMSSRCASPAGTSRFIQRLEQKGAVRREEDCLSPTVRRVAESNLSRASSIASLGGSYQNLAQLRGSMMNLSMNGGEASPSLNKFHSMSSPARKSLSDRIKNTTERQQLVLDRLNKLRDSLHSGKNYTPPRVSRIGSTTGIMPTTPTKQ